MTYADEWSGEDFAEDLRSGMTDPELMEKYKLTPRGLGTVFRNLLNSRKVRFAHLLKRSEVQANLPELVADLRSESREHLEFLLPISDSENPENTGFVHDITDDGVGARGVKAQVDEIRTYIIAADDYFRAEPVVFKGICCWVDEKEDRWESGAGFKVVKPLQGSLEELRRLVEALKPESDDG